MIREHGAALLSLGMIGAIFLTLVLHGMKDETIVAILATGAVGIANTVAGVKPPSSGAPPQIPQLPQLPQTPAPPPVVVVATPPAPEVPPVPDAVPTA